MLRRWLKKCLPTHQEIENHSHFTWLKTRLRHKNLWHFTCQSVARGVAIGLFVAFVPLPGQMILAALFSILLQANLPLAVLLTWVSNPITFLPLNYLIYFVGSKILNEPLSQITVPEFSFKLENSHELWTSFITFLSQFSKAFLVGLPVLAIGSALLGYILVIICWKCVSVIRK